MSAPLDARRQLLRGALVLALGLASAGLGWKLTPTQRLAALHGELSLAQSVPLAFGDWRQDSLGVASVVNPQQEAQLKQLYSQVLTRNYVNSRGQRIMLSIAYGNDQRDGMQLHYPEVCYPAQGFQLRSNRPVTLQLGESRIPARQLETVLNEQRYEPVTYWTVIGEVAVRGGLDKKLVEMRYGLRGLIPDGLLFRVSSIGRDSVEGFALQQQFLGQLSGALASQARSRLLGQ